MFKNKQDFFIALGLIILVIISFKTDLLNSDSSPVHLFEFNKFDFASDVKTATFDSTRSDGEATPSDWSNLINGIFK